MRSGDIVEFNPDHHYVYELLDSWDEVFYVGKTNNPQWRLNCHWRGSGNAAVTARVREHGARMRILYGPVSEAEATLLERTEIRRPGRVLLNQEHHPEFLSRKRGKPLAEYLRSASKVQET